MRFIYIICILVWLVIHISVSDKLQWIAGQKGYGGFFWWCFWTGPAGWAMVIALPDRRKEVENSPPTFERASVQKPDGGSLEK